MNAYRLASIGLVGNLFHLQPSWFFSLERLPIGFDRIGWKLLPSHRVIIIDNTAYRLASIGLVGNLVERIATAVASRVRSLPIGFDRIGWKPYFCLKR